MQINYIEFQSSDIQATKQFYGAAFGWEFQDWGPDYISFNDGTLDGGFHRVAEVHSGGPLVVLVTDNLEAAEATVRAAGGIITKDIFSFPGGRRFHFQDPSGNILAIWSAS